MIIFVFQKAIANSGMQKRLTEDKKKKKRTSDPSHVVGSNEGLNALIH